MIDGKTALSDATLARLLLAALSAKGGDRRVALLVVADRLEELGEAGQATTVRWMATRDLYPWIKREKGGYTYSWLGWPAFLFPQKRTKAMNRAILPRALTGEVPSGTKYRTRLEALWGGIVALAFAHSRLLHSLLPEGLYVKAELANEYRYVPGSAR